MQQYVANIKMFFSCIRLRIDGNFLVRFDLELHYVPIFHTLLLITILKFKMESNSCL